jgi:hypothetical protein
VRALLLALLILPALGAARVRAEEYEETTPLQRYLVSLQLRDSLEEVRRVYPPAQEWPSTESRGVTRYRVERGMAKAFPAHVATLFVGFRKGKLIEIQLIYDEKKSRALTPEKLAGEYALVYGESRRTGDRFWWSDGKTVLRVFPAELPVVDDGARAIAWRTAVQIFDHSLSAAGD